ncbi:hypothetical protein WR25_26517 [Diploscapter pachys]|uniref:Uncharacterized protein n=1 Tax=Diploscapter pachys TaxID=2018661 RepID=A0A2A2LJ22_9BILA|nr:hypothetical protein WR25_26517 [Diploscapter pachys]
MSRNSSTSSEEEDEKCYKRKEFLDIAFDHRMKLEEKMEIFDKSYVDTKFFEGKIAEESATLLKAMHIIITNLWPMLNFLSEDNRDLINKAIETIRSTEKDFALWDGHLIAITEDAKSLQTEQRAELRNLLKNIQEKLKSEDVDLLAFLKKNDFVQGTPCYDAKWVLMRFSAAKNAIFKDSLILPNDIF